MTAAQKRWSEHIDAWKASGLTCKAYAAQVGVNPSTLSWWKRRLRRMRTVDSVEFIEVTAQAGVARSEPLRVFAGGAEIAVPCGFDEETFARVLGVLQARR